MNRFGHHCVRRGYGETGLTTLTGYYQLIRRSSHPVLHTMLRRIIQDERRHFAFYRAQARARLAAARDRARRLVRWILTNFWTPVGAGVKSDEEVDALALYLFGDSDEGREAARSVDAVVSEMPGLEGLTLLEDVLDVALTRARRTPGYAGAFTAAATGGRSPVAAASAV